MVANAAEVRIARAIEGLEKSSEVIAKSLKSIDVTIAKLQHPAFQGREDEAVTVIADEISTAFAFGYPDINGNTQIYVQADGLLRVHISIEPQHSERFLELLNELPVTGLIVEAVGECDGGNRGTA